MQNNMRRIPMPSGSNIHAYDIPAQWHTNRTLFADL